MRLSLDTAPLIYLVERVAPFAAAVRRRLEIAGTEVVTSEIVRLECRVKPFRDGNTELLQDFDDYLARSVSEVLPITRPVLEKAAELRAKYLFLKTPDAIHLAAAILANCDGFLTNDHRLDRCAEMAVEVLAP